MKNLPGRCVVLIFAFAGLFNSTISFAREEYPTHSIRMIVPFEVGGNTDLVARMLAQELSKRLGKSVFVDNKPGANTIVGSSVTAQAAPDGYTIMMTTLSLAINPSVNRHLPYDTLKDFTPITLVVTLPNVLLVNPALSIKSVQGLIADAKAHPGKLNFSASGIATSPDLSLRLFNLMSGVDIVTIPFKGGGPAMSAVISGLVQGQFVGLPAALPFIKSGQVRALGVTSKARISSASNIPTIAEAVPGYEADNWFAVVGPAKMPPQIVNKLQTEIDVILHSGLFVHRLKALGAEPVGSTPAELSAFLQKEIDKYAKVVRKTGVPVQ
jgi:tripartite-type tricarboxylate transporter receptor subunit TctC